MSTGIEPGVEFGWRVHAAQEHWAARADAKAAVLFTVEGAVVAAVVAAFGNPAIGGSVTGWRLPLVWLGTAASTVAVVTALLVVIPQLGGRRGGEDHFIYFGHLRSWEPGGLAARLRGLTDGDQIDQLSTQLTRVSVRNWRKYVLLHAAVVAAVLGAVMLVLAFVWMPGR